MLCCAFAHISKVPQKAPNRIGVPAASCEQQADNWSYLDVKNLYDEDISNCSTEQIHCYSDYLHHQLEAIITILRAISANVNVTVPA